VVEDFAVVDNNAEFPFHRVFRLTGRDVRAAVIDVHLHAYWYSYLMRLFESLAFGLGLRYQVGFGSKDGHSKRNTYGFCGTWSFPF
jgi:hypothetical protein